MFKGDKSRKVLNAVTDKLTSQFSRLPGEGAGSNGKNDKNRKGKGDGPLEDGKDNNEGIKVDNNGNPIFIFPTMRLNNISVQYVGQAVHFAIKRDERRLEYLVAEFSLRGAKKTSTDIIIEHVTVPVKIKSSHDTPPRDALPSDLTRLNPRPLY